MSDASLGCDEFSWSPPLPTIGRGGQRARLPVGVISIEDRLDAYYLQVDSVPDFFVRSIPYSYRRSKGLVGKSYPAEKIYLKDLPYPLQFGYIMSKLYGHYSLHFQRKLSSLLKAGQLSTVRQWFYTANGVVLPYIMEGYDDTSIIDRLTKYTLEGCASNYAHFISSLKRLKKLMKKSCAINGLYDHCPKAIVALDGSTRQHAYYLSLFNDTLKKVFSVRERFRSLLLWTQTRATGLCDGTMIKASLDKFRKTVTEPCHPLWVDVGILKQCIRTGNVTGHEAQVSCGPKACLQAPQKPVLLRPGYYLPGQRQEPVGGQTRYLLYLARHRVLRGRYDLKNLEIVERFDPPRPVRSSQDLLSWAIQEALSCPWKVGSVRYHCVADQSKARSITVAHYAYQVILGTFAHALVPAVKSAETRSGLGADRHLWNFIHSDLSPESPSWDEFAGQACSFSTDLEEATDFGNWWFARAVWSEFIRQTRGPSQPTGLFLLAKTLYTSPRTVFYRAETNRYRWFRTSRGFLMGDLFTKVILTIGQDYNVRKALLDSPIGRTPPNALRHGRTVSVKPYNLATLREVGLLDEESPRRKIGGAAYSLVGDDVVVLYCTATMLAYRKQALLYNSIESSNSIDWSYLEPWFRRSAESGGWKLSDNDTFDSEFLMFYAEEGSMVPSSAQSTTRHAMWRGRSVDYLDYPRIRLLLPVRMEQDIYSQTNVGRFSLLGKEAKWVEGSATTRARLIYRRAQLVQHVLVPRDIECLCPFVPTEIGGDGAFPHSSEFLSDVIRVKAIDPAEVLYRMRTQLMGMWSHKYLACDKPREAVHKHALLLPTYDRLRKWLPERAVIVPPTAEHRTVLDAVPRGLLETPQLTFWKLVKRLYYSHLFRGKMLPSLNVRADVESKRGFTSLSVLKQWFEEENRYELYRERWVRPGFTYYNKEPYYVVPFRHKDIMSVGWNWKFRPERGEELARLDVHDFLDVILHNKDLPLVVDRLNLFFETDPLLKIRVMENHSIRGVILVVTCDRRLCVDIGDYVRSNRDRTCRVKMVHPAIFFLGRIEEVSGNVTLLDSGAINFFGRTADTSNLTDVPCADIRTNVDSRYKFLYSVTVKGLQWKPVRPKIRTDETPEGFAREVAISGQVSREFGTPLTRPRLETEYYPEHIAQALGGDPFFT